MDPAPASEEVVLPPGLKAIKDISHFKSVKTNYTTREANTKLKSASDLVSLYVETNQKVQARLKAEQKMSDAPREFQDITKVLVELQSIFDELVLEIKDLWGAYRELPFSKQF